MSFGSTLPSDRRSTPQEDLAASVATRLGLNPTTLPVVEAPPEPFGKSWLFDWEQGTFVRAGSAPIETRGLGALIEWCEMAIHSARYANDVFSDRFGMEGIGDPIGEFAVGEIVADWQRHLTEALLVHDRIAAVQNIQLSFDPTQGVLTVETLEVVTDESEIVALGDIRVQGPVTL